MTVVDEERERQLLQRARNLDEEALTEIHNLYYGRLYRYMAFRVSPEQTAEDLTSELFIRFLSAIRDRHAPPNSLRGWLFGTASNLVKEHYRQQKRENWDPLDTGITNRGPTPDQLTEEAMTKAQLKDAMAQLTEEQQQVLALRFGFEMPMAQIAEALNKSEGSVKMLQTRAIAGLTRHLRKEEVGA